MSPLVPEHLIEQLPEMAAVVGSDGRLLRVNGSLCRFHGEVRGGLTGARLSRLWGWEALPPGVRGEGREEEMTALLETLPSSMMCQMLRCDGQLRHMRVEARALDRGRALMIFYDMTEEQLLREAFERDRRVIEACQELICIIDQGGGIQFTNAACHRSLGYAPQQMKGTSLFDYVHPADLGRVWRVVQGTSQNAGQQEEELRLCEASGAVRYVSVVAQLLDSQPETHILLVGRDDTQQHQLQQALMESQKMEGMGRLARGIAHDFNNLLQLILGSVQCLDQEAVPESIVDWHDTIRTAAERGRTLVEQLQAFSNQDAGIRLPHALGDVLNELMELVRPMLSGEVRFEVEIHEPGCVIEVNLGQLQQVLVNLCINAREALEGEGEIFLESEDVTRAGRAFVGVSIKDTGHGISPEHLTRIFEPFFSTKENRRGTGLGLSVAYGIIEAHGGSIEVDSKVGRGSRFRVLLPLAPPGTEAVPMNHRPEMVFGNDELILVIDDEPMQRMILRKQLEFLGYGVLMAEDGVKALDLYEDYADEIDCVLLDVVMPHLGGRETLERLQQVNPSITVIVTTGLGRDDTVTAMLAEGARGFLAKPFSIEHLGSLIRSVIARARSPEDA